jgi:hypothetical protein
LPLLLAARNDRLEEFDRKYVRINDSILKGIEQYKQWIPRGAINA